MVSIPPECYVMCAVIQQTLIHVGLPHSTNQRDNYQIAQVFFCLTGYDFGNVRCSFFKVCSESKIWGFIYFVFRPYKCCTNVLPRSVVGSKRDKEVKLLAYTLQEQLHWEPLTLRTTYSKQNSSGSYQFFCNTRFNMLK